jgi:predicted transcriptional regulator
VMMMTVKVPSDVRKKLEEWAAFNVSSMMAELIRSVRDRAEREHERAAS